MRKISFCTIRLSAMALALGMIFALTPRTTPAGVHVGVFVNFAPPELPVYAQPVCPGDNYIWTPGYWAWDPAVGDYYWVPGTWVLPPMVGFLWTPGYWAWGADGYFFNAGYWGPTVGFYGGIDYGFGYYGHGFDGGRWEHGHFYYNREVSNVNVSIVHNVYSARAIHETGGVSRVSFNGGRGGVNVRPTRQEEAAAHERHLAPVAAQTRHIAEARANRQLRASVNHGAPPIAATAKPGEFSGRGVMKTREAGAVHTPPARRETTAARANHGAHPGYTPAARKSVEPTRENPRANNSYQQQRSQLMARQQNEERQLQQQQNRERQQIERQNASRAARQQMEQRHQQQTRQLTQRHTQEMRQFQQRQTPREQGHPQGRPH